MGMSQGQLRSRAVGVWCRTATKLVLREGKVWTVCEANEELLEELRCQPVKQPVLLPASAVYPGSQLEVRVCAGSELNSSCDYYRPASVIDALGSGLPDAWLHAT
jgi:hypothetical protein